MQLDHHNYKYLYLGIELVYLYPRPKKPIPPMNLKTYLEIRFFGRSSMFLSMFDWAGDMMSNWTGWYMPI